MLSQVLVLGNKIWVSKSRSYSFSLTFSHLIPDYSLIQLLSMSFEHQKRNPQPKIFLGRACVSRLRIIMVTLKLLIPYTGTLDAQ